MSESPVIKRMLERFNLAVEAESNNRERGLENLRFYKGGDYQWDSGMLKRRNEDARPSESYNQLPQFVHQVTNDMRMNMPQTKFIPGNDGTKEVAEAYEDLARNIQAASEAEVAYDMAAFYQVVIGWAYWFYYTEYENDKTFDQIINIGAKKNPFTIYDDPTSIMPDGLDRQWLIDICDLPVKDFNIENDKKYSTEDLSSIGDHSPEWADSEDGIVRVASYWEKTETKTKLYRTKKGKVSKEKPKGNDFEEREVCIPKIKYYKCTAREILEERDWIGSMIPYVRITGEELNIDGKTIYNGLVENMKGAQKQFNYWSNAAIEMAALAPKSPYTAAVGQIEGLEDIWDTANQKNYSVLPYNPMEVNGTLLPPPQRTQTGVDLNPMINLLNQAQNNFYTTTGIYAASLGEKSNEKSGKAILARQREGDVSTFHFTDNMARGLRAGGRILSDLIPKIYDGTRTIRGTKEDKSTRQIKINQKYFDEDKGEEVEYDLTLGDYDVMVTTGPSYTTKRQESNEFYQALAQAYPPFMEIAGDIVVGTSDSAGADEAAERLRKAIQMRAPGLIEDKKEDQISPQVQQQMQQMQQIIQQGAQEIQQLQQEVDSKQADIAKSQAEIQLKQQQMQINAQDSQRKAELDQMNMQLEQAKLQLAAEDQQLERMKIELQAAQIQLNHAQKSQVQPQGGEDMGLSREALMAQMQALDEQEQAQQQDALNQQMMAEQQSQMHAQKEAEEQMKSQALMDNLMAIQQSIMQLTASIAAPKQIIRDPKTGLVAGVVNTQAIQTVGNA